MRRRTLDRMTMELTRRVLGHSLGYSLIRLYWSFIHLRHTASCAPALAPLLASPLTCSTWPSELICPLTCSLSLLIHSLAVAPHCLLPSRTYAYSLARSLTHWLGAYGRELFVRNMNESTSYSFNPLCGTSATVLQLLSQCFRRRFTRVFPSFPPPTIDVVVGC